jgi:hypothetical protein
MNTMQHNNIDDNAHKATQKNYLNTLYSDLDYIPKGEIIDLNKTAHELITALRICKNTYPPYVTDFLPDVIQKLKKMLPIQDNKENRNKLQFIIDDTMQKATDVRTYRGKYPISHTIYKIFVNNSTSDDKIKQLLAIAGVNVPYIQGTARANIKNGFSKNEITTAQYKIKLMRLPLFQQFVTEIFKIDQSKGREYIYEIMAAESIGRLFQIAAAPKFNKRFKYYMQQCFSLITNYNVNDQCTISREKKIQNKIQKKIQKKIQEKIKKISVPTNFSGKMNSIKEMIQTANVHINNIELELTDIVNKGEHIITDINLSTSERYPDNKVTIRDVKFSLIDGVYTPNDYRLAYLINRNFDDKLHNETDHLVVKSTIKPNIKPNIKHNPISNNSQLFDKKLEYIAGIADRYKKASTQRLIEDLASAPFVARENKKMNKDTNTRMLDAIQDVNKYLKNRATETSVFLTIFNAGTGKDYYARRKSWMKILSELSNVINSSWDLRGILISKLRSLIESEAEKFNSRLQFRHEYHDILIKLLNTIANIPDNNEFNEKIFNYQQMYANMDSVKQNFKQKISRKKSFNISHYDIKLNEQKNIQKEYNKKAYQYTYNLLSDKEKESFLSPDEEYQYEQKNCKYFSSSKRP